MDYTCHYPELFNVSVSLGTLYSISYLAGNAAEATQVMWPYKSHSTCIAVQLFLIRNASYGITTSICNNRLADVKLRQIAYFCTFVLPVCTVLGFGHVRCGRLLQKCVALLTQW